MDRKTPLDLAGRGTAPLIRARYDERVSEVTCHEAHTGPFNAKTKVRKSPLDLAGRETAPLIRARYDEGVSEVTCHEAHTGPFNVSDAGVGAYRSRIIAAAIGALAFASVAVLCTTLILPLIAVELVVGIAAVGAVVGGLAGWAADALFFSPEERQESENAHGM